MPKIWQKMKKGLVQKFLPARNWNLKQNCWKKMQFCSGIFFSLIARNHAKFIVTCEKSKYEKNANYICDLPFHKSFRHDMYHKIAKAPNIDLILASNENAQMFAILIKKSDKSKFLLLIFFIISRLNCNTAAIEEIKRIK